MPIYLGIRHLSPNGAYNVVKKLDELKPKTVLIEGPADFTDQIKNINKLIKPPFAILAYTTQKPIETLLLPFAEYSPEYQAILWCIKNKAECKFIDLPSKNSLALEYYDDEEVEDNVFNRLDEEFGDYENFWESNIEHAKDDYFEIVNTFGQQLRETLFKSQVEIAKNILRESYMKKRILEEDDNCVVICGAYHIEGLKNIEPMTDDELFELNVVDINYTFMPYTYFKLSNQSGYGAGNRAPQYYEELWDKLNNNDVNNLTFDYLSKLAREMREQGFNTSTALVIDAINLANSLANLRGQEYPTLLDLEAASITCFGEGDEVSLLKAKTLIQIGVKVGELPEGTSNTSLQKDFYNSLDELKLEKYKDSLSHDLVLDLRENIHAKKEELAFLDLNRSFFFHQLEILGVSFAKDKGMVQRNATYKESFSLKWDTNVEIQLIEASLLGDTLEKAVMEKMFVRLQESFSIESITANIRDCFLCGLSNALDRFVVLLQSATIDSKDFHGFCACIDNLSTIITYKDLRKVSVDNIEEILKQLYLKALLCFNEACDCPDTEVGSMMNNINILDQASKVYDYLDVEMFLEEVIGISNDYTVNQFLAGYCTSILLERGKLTPFEAESAISYHLSRGMDQAKAANWLEGFCMKNHYQLILNINIWQILNSYIESLDIEEFKPVLLFLRRAFANFTPNEKDSIVENLSEVWGIKVDKAQMLDKITELDLDGFDFDDF